MPILVAGGGERGEDEADTLALGIGGVRILVPAGFEPGRPGRVIAAIRSPS